MKYQPNIPTDLYNKFIENLGYTPKNEKILVVRDIYTACYLSINNEVTFVSDDSEAISMFVNTVIVNPEFGTNDSYVFVNENTNTEWLNTIDWVVKNMKFDVAIMNPPYDGNLHLKILEKVIPVADKVVNISPIRWLQDPLAKYKKNSDYKKFENSISKKIDDITFISTEESNKLFNILLLQPLAIYTISNGGYNYDFCTPLLKKIFDKILLENNFSKLKISNYNDNLVNFVLINKMAPPMKYGKPMFDALKTWCGYFTNKVNKKGETYQMAKDNCKASVRGDINKDIAIVFTTDKETINCYNAFCTKFARFCCMKSVVDIHVHQKFLPYMPDYTQPWTDKRFCEYFGITGYIDDEHAEPGSEWETILKTMEQYK